AKSQAVEIAGGAGMILYNVDDVSSLVSDNHYVPSLHTNNTDGLVIKDYIAANEAPTATLSGGTKTSAQGSVMAAFSSRGPNAATGAADLIQPDVTAPGVNVLAGNTPTALSGAPGQLFQAISGTSMSSPHVAGAFALLKQAHPDWSPAAAKSALMTTSRQDVVKEDGVTPADPFDMGAGHIVPTTALSPGIVYDAGFLDYLGFLCEAAPEVFSDAAATCASLVGLGIPTDGSELNVPSIGIAELVGAQTVTRTVTDVSGVRDRYRITAEAPPGVSVEVSPRVLRVPANGSASYTVTFTANDDAALGEWAFGSVTLSGIRHGAVAYSPTAVKPALFDAAAQVSGTGTDGSAEFSATFGYTGDYTAAAHGMEPAVGAADSVNQDPDQTFDPSDVGAGATAHTFDLTGMAFARFALPPESVADAGLTDLDMFVYDPSGTLVGSSTNGGTDETVDVALPDAGVYTVYVHGWLVNTDPEPYTLYSWIVSATPGGSLVIDSAPASATLGATETIDVSWSGLDAGTMYLGAVSHTGPDGLLGFTLVQVSTFE
ncbi:MAG: S8 family serine peptidase, partial [Acidimicrobiia bacterium]|nr:S8 family serine peptidase [Acidimicrobiia bacterium]